MQAGASSAQSLSSQKHGGGTVKKAVLLQQSRTTSHNSQVDALPHLIAGGAAGAISKTCMAPLSRLTILLQIQGVMHSHNPNSSLRNKTGILREASRIIHEEGFRAFWKGNLVTVIHRLPYSSLNFYTYERYKAFLRTMADHVEGLNKDNACAEMGIRLLGGGGAGITATAVAYPLDVVRTRLSAQTNSAYYKGIMQSMSRICRDEGFRGLYRGLGASLLGVAPNMSLNYCSYETLKCRWLSKRPNDHHAAVGLGCGIFSGFASSTATYPLDLVKRRMQLQGAAGVPARFLYTTGIVGAFKHIVRTEGWGGLYRGIIPEVCKVVPGVSICFMTYEIVKMMFSPRPPEK
eukprot:Gb_26624 [translate_table: standard]